MDERFTEQARKVSKLLRSQDQTGALMVDDDTAMELIIQAMRAAHAQGQLKAAMELGDSMLQALDTASRAELAKMRDTSR
jgi:uncharacterized protein with PIN domain